MKLEPIEGLRAFVHLGIVLLHGHLYTTAHMPNEGALWETYNNHWLSKVLFYQGLGVDVFFALSGFLLAHTFIRQSSMAPPTILKFVVKRIGRIFPTLFLFLIVSLIFGDPYNGQSTEGKLMGLAAILFLVPNYLGFAYFPLALGPAWSCFVDIHSGICMLVLMTLVRSGGRPNSYNMFGYARKIRLWFSLMLVISIVIRAYCFNVTTYNELLPPKYLTYLFFLTPRSNKWIAETYQRKYLVGYLCIIMTNSLLHADTFRATWAPYAEFSFGHYLGNLYLPSHTRIGPFFVGGILACNLVLANESSDKVHPVFNAKRFSYACMAIVALSLSLVNIDWALSLPHYAQLIFTAGNRVAFSAGVAYFLFCTLVPRNHPCHWAPLRLFWSSPMWKPISAVSFTSYLFHMRIMQEITFNTSVRNIFGLQVPTGMNPTDVLSWYYYGYHLAFVTFIITFPIATFAHWFVDVPCDAYIRSLVEGSPSNKVTGDNKANEDSTSKSQ